MPDFDAFLIQNSQISYKQNNTTFQMETTCSQVRSSDQFSYSNRPFDAIFLRLQFAADLKQNDSFQNPRSRDRLG